MLILISDAFDASLPERLTQFGEVTTDTARVADADIVLIRSKTKCTREYIDAAPNLKMIIRGGVGLDNVDREYAIERGIAVHNTPEASSVAVAEMALAMMLAAINHIVPAHTSMAEGRWLKKEFKRSELYQKTLGLIGIGRIGSEVAKRAKAFEMNVIACDPGVQHSDVATLVSLEQLLQRADIISLHTPLLPSTRGMLNAERIAMLKPNCVVVNTARGAVIDEVAMAKALEAGKLACYATDVYTSDPPPADCPLLKAPRMLMAPHIGASSTENLLRIGDMVVELIAAFKKGA